MFIIYARIIGLLKWKQINAKQQNVWYKSKKDLYNLTDNCQNEE